MVALATAFVRVRPDASGFKRDTEKQIRGAGAQSGEKFGDEFAKGADRKLRDGRLAKSGESAGDSIGRGARKGLTKGFGDGGSGVFGRVLAIAGAKTTLFGAAAAAAAPGVLRLTGALAPAAGSVIALPALLGAAAAAMGTLKLATLGVGDAIKAGFTGDADKAAEALKKLSPETREFARSVIDLKGRLTGLQQTTADQFFRRFNTQVQPLARAWLPLLNRQVPILAGSMGGLVKQFALAARQGPLLAGVRAVLGNTASAATALERAVKPVVAALGRLLIVGAPTIRNLAIGFASAATRAAEFVSNAAKTGQLGRWLAAGLATLRDLAGITGNIIGIFKSLVVAANAGGNTLLSTFRQLTGQVNTFLASAQGMGTLRTIFATLSQIGQALRTSLGAVLPVVAQSLALLGPTIARLATVAGDFIVALAPAVPVFAQIANLLLRAAIPALSALAGWMARNEGVVKGLAVAAGVLVLAVNAYSLGAKAAALATNLWALAGKAASIATKVWTGIQWLFNAAMTANPIGIVIVAIAALVAGVIIAYKKSETFRAIVDAALRGVAAAGMWMWNNVLKPTFAALVAAWDVVAAAGLWLWRNVLAPAFKGIAGAVQFAWGNVIQPALAALTWWFRNVTAPVVMWLWRNIVKPAWAGIQLEIRVAWAVIKVIFGLIKSWITNVIAPTLTWLWKNIAQPVFRGLALDLKIAWAIIKVVFGLIVIAVKATLVPTMLGLWAIAKFVWSAISAQVSASWAIIKILWATLVAFVRGRIIPTFQFLHTMAKVIWAGIAGTISAVWTKSIRPTLTALGGIISKYVVPAFRLGVTAIGNAWARIQDLASKPVSFVVGVINRGIISPYNKLAKIFGGPHVDPIVFGPGTPFRATRSGRQEFADGGRIPGAPSRRDNRLAVGPNGLLKVATGEFVTNAMSTAKNLPLVAAINRKRGKVTHADVDPYLDGFAAGGLVGDIWGAISDPAKAIKRPAEAMLSRIPGASLLRNVAVGMGRKLLGALMGWIGKLGGGPLGGGNAMGWRRMQALIGGQFPGLGMISGFRPGARTLSGSRSYHALGRAVDYPPSRALAAWIRARFGANTKELITPFQDLNLWNGRPHTFTGAVWNQHNFAGGNAHVHWAMAQGGLMKKLAPHIPVFDLGGVLHPGPNLVDNRTGGYEHLVPAGRRGGNHFHLHNHGVIGSQRELDAWLVSSTTRLKREGRL